LTMVFLCHDELIDVFLTFGLVGFQG